jgi:DNA-binding GntR family transcriptional regulator
MANSASVTLDPAAAPRLSSQAYLQIEERIVLLRLPPGQFLSEKTLAAHLGIGRTPVREALQQLARENLVKILPRRGVLVAEMDVRAQIELLAVRREIERLMARLAAKRATKTESTVFAALAEAMLKSVEDNDDVAFMRLDREFNVLLETACRNDYAKQCMRLMQGPSRRFWYKHYQEALDLPRCAKLHADVASLIAERKPEEAAAASDALIDYIEDFTRASLYIDSRQTA